MASVLADAANPYPVLDWVRRSPSAHLLAQLVRQPGSLTHEALDALPQNAPTSYVRGLLVTAGILTRRDENLARLERWVTRTLAKLPSTTRTSSAPSRSGTPSGTRGDAQPAAATPSAPAKATPTTSAAPNNSWPGSILTSSSSAP